jgi:hypothetical protein
MTVLHHVGGSHVWMMSKKQSPSREADSLPPGKEIPAFPLTQQFITILLKGLQLENSSKVLL